MPHYRIEGKLTEPMTDKDFIDGMVNGKFVEPSHRAYCVLLYYSAVRKSEARRVLKEQFRLTPKFLVFEVLRRLKHGIETPPLKIPLDAPYVSDLVNSIEETPTKTKVFRFSDKTAYNAVRRVYHYPHFFRLSRITSFFAEGWNTAQVKNWTGLSLAALDYYVGLVDIDRMAASLSKKRKPKRLKPKEPELPDSAWLDLEKEIEDYEKNEKAKNGVKEHGDGKTWRFLVKYPSPNHTNYASSLIRLKPILAIQ